MKHTGRLLLELRFGLGIGLTLLLAAAWSGCSRPAPASKNAWLGLNTHFVEPSLPAAPTRVSPQDRRMYLDMVSELRVPMIRDLAMNWAAAQPEPEARYDFSQGDELVRLAQAAKADLLAVYWGVPSWARSPHSALPARPHTDAFRAFVRRFVQRYDGDGVDDMTGLRRPIRAYEFMSEIEDLPTAEYAYWLRVFYETVKLTHPKVVVSLGSLRSPGLPMIDRPDGDYPTWFERLLAEPALAGPNYPYFDVVSFHNYPARYPGRSEFDEPLAYLQRTMAERNLALPVWLTEYGFSSADGREERQKGKIVRWALHARALGIERVYLHCLWDCPWQAAAAGRQNSFGLLESGGARKPAFQAFATLLAEVQERPDVSRRGEGVYMLTGKNDPVYAVWRDENDEAAPLLMRDWWELRMLTGRVLTRQGSEITPGASPVFLQRVRSPFIR